MINKWYPGWSQYPLRKAGRLVELGAAPLSLVEGLLEVRLDGRRGGLWAAPCR
jgi:hypothetical protein